MFPFDVDINVFMPKSIPIVVSSDTNGFVFLSSPVSQSIDAKNLPEGVLLMVACFISPFVSRSKTMLMPFLNLGIISLPFSKETFCGMLKLPKADFFLNLGNLPCPLKKRVKALSKFLIGDCKDCELISFNHSHSFLRSGSCFIRSKQLRLTLCAAYATCFVSSAKLYTNLALPICLFNKLFCSDVGYKRYLKDFNILQIYDNLNNYNRLFKKFFLYLSIIMTNELKQIAIQLLPALIERSPLPFYEDYLTRIAYKFAEEVVRQGGGE